MWLGPTAPAVWGKSRVVSLTRSRKLAEAAGELVGGKTEAASAGLAIELVVSAKLEVAAVELVADFGVLSTGRFLGDLDLVTDGERESAGSARFRLWIERRTSSFGVGDS